MLEREWLKGKNPQAMLHFLDGKASDRKWRLFACGSLRYIYDLILTDESRRAVEAAEYFADGMLSALELKRMASLAAARACLPEDGLEEYTADCLAARVDALCDEKSCSWHAGWISGMVWQVQMDPYGYSETKWQLWEEYQVELIHELFGNPFSRSVLDSAWLSWNGGTVRRIADSIYENRQFEGYLVLADALEESGCTEISILDHCRRGAKHARGCWVLDILLGKQTWIRKGTGIKWDSQN